MWWDTAEERRKTDPECIFCQILKGELPSAKVYSDDLVYAFADISPMAKVHVLVIPRQHVTFLTESTPENEELLGHMLRAGAWVAEQTGIADSGYRLSINQGINAGQLVDHLHLHVLGGEQLMPLGETRVATES